MLCKNCEEYNHGQKCCGSVPFTVEEKDRIVALGYNENMYFKHSNAGWSSKRQVAGRFEGEENGEKVNLIISRCMFLDLRDTIDKGRCLIYPNRPQICKDFPRNDVESNWCGTGGWEGTGWDVA
jgi:Fe-S-cluster containining protein